MEYSRETLEYIRAYSEKIRKASETIGVDSKAVGGVIANEDDYIRKNHESGRLDFNKIGEDYTSWRSHGAIEKEYNDWQPEVGSVQIGQCRPHRTAPRTDSILDSGKLAMTQNGEAVLALLLIAFLSFYGFIFTGFRIPIPKTQYVSGGFASIDKPITARYSGQGECKSSWLLDQAVSVETSIQEVYPLGTSTDLLVSDLEEKKGKCEGTDGSFALHCNYLFSLYKYFHHSGLPPKIRWMEHYTVHLEITGGKAVEDISVRIGCRIENPKSGGFEPIDGPMRYFYEPGGDANLLNKRANEVKNGILELYPLGSDTEAFIEDLTAKKGFCREIDKKVACTYLYSEVHDKISSDGVREKMEENFFVNLSIDDNVTIKNVAVVVGFKSESSKMKNKVEGTDER